MIDLSRLREDATARRQPLRGLFRGLFPDLQQSASGQTRLAVMPFNVRCQNCLHQAGLATLGALNEVCVDALLELPAFGWGTLANLLTVYRQSFESDFASAGTADGHGSDAPPEWEDWHTQYSDAVGARRLSAAALSRPILSLGMPLSRRARQALARLGVRTVGELLARTPGELAQGVPAGVFLVVELRGCLTQAVEQCVLADAVREALGAGPLRCPALEAAGAALDVQAEEVWARILTVPGVVRVADRAHWVEGCQAALLPHWTFASYSDLLRMVLHTGLRRQHGEVLADFYGLFSEPLSRTALAAKNGGVTPQLIYQIIHKCEQKLRHQRALLALLRLPVGELLRQGRGITSVAALERGLVEHFGCEPGEVRGAGLLAMLEGYGDSGLTVLEGRLALAPPVMAGLVEAAVDQIVGQLAARPHGMRTEEVQEALSGHWGQVLPGRAAPDVAAEDLAWLRPRIVVEDGVWCLRRRGRRPRVTDRPTQIGQMEAVLAEHGRPLLVQDLFDLYRERHGEINVPACRTMLKKNEQLFRAYERGVYGLVGWRNFAPSEIEAIRQGSRRSTPRTLRDKVEAVLEENGLPMHFQELFRALQERLGEADERGLRSALFVCPERFQTHGNGVYGLTAWGEDAAREVAGAVIEYLEQRGYPATETEICDGLRGQFSISVPVCRWALRQAWERSGDVVPLEGGLWDVGDAGASGAGGGAGVSVDDLLLEQLLSC